MTTYFLCRPGRPIGQAVMDVILTKHPAGDWITGQVQANFGTVSDEEFERLRQHPEAVLVGQSIGTWKSGEDHFWLDPYIAGVFGAGFSPSGDTLVLLRIGCGKWNACVYLPGSSLHPRVRERPRHHQPQPVLHRPDS